MCGIIGCIDLKGTLTEDRFKDSLHVLEHRGPDEYGTFNENGFFIGMHRLSIIDLAGGQQPIYNESRNRALVFNGEIYNYKELVPELEAKGHQFSTKTDTETVIHSLEEGEERIADLRGMFAFAQYDREKHELLLCRDRAGQKPIYYLKSPGQFFVFASEIKALIHLASHFGYQPEINPEAIYHYLSFLNIPQPLTIYKDVLSVQRAHTLKVDQSLNISEQPYWDYDFDNKLDLGYEEAQEQVRDIISESVKIRLRSDVPVGIFLSGGVDSSVVAYEAKKYAEDVKTFTVQIEGDAEFDESVLAEKTARDLGLPNYKLNLKINPHAILEQVIDCYDQPFADPSAIPSMEISRLASEHVKVVLNGDGGDEQFAGYRRFVLMSKLDSLPGFVKMMAPVLNYGLKGFKRRSYLGFLHRMGKILQAGSLPAQYIALTTDVFSDSEKGKIWRSDAGLSTTDLISAKALDHLNGVDGLTLLDRNFNLLSGLLVKMDIASSAHSLEARSPFLDHKLFEFSSRLPVDFKTKGGITKRILRDAYKGKLSEEVLFGKKKGFEIPLQRWLSEDFKDVKFDYFSGNAECFRFLDQGYVKKAMLHNDQSLGGNQAYVQYALLVLEAWLRKHKN